MLLFNTVANSQAPPQVTAGLKLNDGATEGYTLIPPLRGAGVYLINNDAQLVHQWVDLDEDSPGYACPPGNATYIKENGNLLKSCVAAYDESNNLITVPEILPPGSRGGTVLEYDWDSNLKWYFQYADATENQEKWLHHDIEIIPNGNKENVLVTAWEREGLRNVNTHQVVSRFISEAIYEVEPDYVKGYSTEEDIVWGWKMVNHFCQDESNRFEHYYDDCSKHPELWDLKLTLDNEGNVTGVSEPRSINSINYDKALKQIFISSNLPGELWVIDRTAPAELTKDSSKYHTGGKYKSGGDFLYRWGNPQNYGAGDSEDQQLFYQHKVTSLQTPPTFGYKGLARLGLKGKIIFFNNRFGTKNPSTPSIVAQINPPTKGQGKYVQPSAPGVPFGPETFVKGSVISQVDLGDAGGITSINSRFLSNVQLFPNGNYLIPEATTGTVYEVESPDDNGIAKAVWAYVSPFINTNNDLPTLPLDPDSEEDQLLADGDTIPICEPIGPCNFFFRAERYSEKFKGFKGKDLTPKDSDYFWGTSL
ncbi:MAG: hypothetical protein SWZ49_09080 [Cyanobacteriota bacterium]|nr:hypothetical protein [Cyanobacteriota bacterium]